MSITKSGPATVAAGGAVAYQLTVANAGPAAATGLSVVDTLPAGVTFVSASGTGLDLYERRERVGDLHPGLDRLGRHAPVITVNVTAQAQAGTMVNSAAVTATTPDPVPANNTATASTTVTARADLAITKTGPATVTAGANVTYSLVVQNLGPSDAAVVERGRHPCLPV